MSLTIESAPAEPGTGEGEEPLVQWLMPEPAAPRRGLAAWALAFSIGGLVFSLFVGWGFPIGLVGIVSAILALRRPLESRAVAVWALVLGIVSVLFSAGWLLFAASRAQPLRLTRDVSRGDRDAVREDRDALRADPRDEERRRLVAAELELRPQRRGIDIHPPLLDLEPADARARAAPSRAPSARRAAPRARGTTPRTGS